MLLVVGLSAPAPAQADFYRYPSQSQIAAGPVGSMLAFQPMRFSSRPRPAVALRVMYRSEDATGRRIAVTGFVMVPHGSPPRAGWPIVAWDHGTVGVGWPCAPSRSPILADPGYGPFVARLVSEGFVVVGTDYEGLGFRGVVHKYLQMESEARGVIDLVRATRRLVPGTSRRWVTVGHSQGGQAALGAGLLASGRAPDLDYLGAIPIAPGSHIGGFPAYLASFHRPYPKDIWDVASYTSFAALSTQRFSPGFNPREILSPALVRELPYAKDHCLADVEKHLRTLRPAPPRLVNPNYMSSFGWQRFVSANEPAQYLSSGPILLVQGTADKDIIVTNLLNIELCGLGDTVAYRTYRGADHDSVIPRAYKDMVRWIRDRLAGRRAPQTCTT